MPSGWEGCCFILKLDVYAICDRFSLLYVFWAEGQNEKPVGQFGLPYACEKLESTVTHFLPYLPHLRACAFSTLSTVLTYLRHGL